MQRVKVAESGRSGHLLCDVAAFQPVDLVQRDHDRHVEREDTLRDEAVAGTDPLAGREHEHNDIHVLERGIHSALHPLGESIERTLEARQVGEHELVVVAVGDPEDAATRRLRLVGDDRDLAAAERVDERRLADIRPSCDRGEPRLHGRSQASGKSVDAGAYSAIEPSSRRK